MTINELDTILEFYGVDVRMLKDFGKDCPSVKSCLNRLRLVLRRQDHTVPSAEHTRQFMRIFSHAIAELSFRNRLAFKHAFELEQEKKAKKT